MSARNLSSYREGEVTQQPKYLRSFGATARIATLAGLAGSAGLVLYAGRQNDSWLLMALFSFWVISPFLAALLTDAISKLWRPFARTAIYGVMLLLPAASLALYTVAALGPPSSRKAFVFLVTPAASWMLLAIVAAIGALASGRRSPHS